MKSIMKKLINILLLIHFLCIPFAVYADPYATVTAIDGKVILKSTNKQIKILQKLNDGDIIEVIEGKTKIVFSNDENEYVLAQKGIYTIASNKNICMNGKLITGSRINENVESIPMNEIQQSEQGAFNLRSAESDPFNSPCE